MGLMKTRRLAAMQTEDDRTSVAEYRKTLVVAPVMRAFRADLLAGGALRGFAFGAAVAMFAVSVVATLAAAKGRLRVFWLAIAVGMSVLMACVSLNAALGVLLKLYISLKHNNKDDN